MDVPQGEFVVSTSLVLPAKRWQVLRLLTRVEDFPAYLPEVKECRVLSRRGRKTGWGAV